MPVETPGQRRVFGKPARIGQGDKVEPELLVGRIGPPEAVFPRKSGSPLSTPMPAPAPIRTASAVGDRSALVSVEGDGHVIDRAAHFFLVQTAARSSEACSRMPLSERISSVALSASWWSKTIVSENLSSKTNRREFLLRIAKHLHQVAEVLDRHSVDLLDDLGERVVVALADPVGKHRRGDDDQLLAFELGEVAAPGGQRAADERQQRVEPPGAIE